MAEKQIYPDIPEPNPDASTLYKVVVAVKQTLETLTGKIGPVGWSNQTFVQRTRPKAVKVGDGWIIPATLAGEPDIWSIWDGKQWRKITL